MRIKEKTVKGLFWVFLEKVGVQGSQFLIVLILARLLTPEDFGLVAMLLIFFALGKTFVDSGFRQALIRLVDVTEEDKCTTFYFNLFISIAVYGVLYVTAPNIAAFFEEPRLIGLVRFMGISLLFDSLAMVQQAMMSQKMDFKAEFLANLPGVVLSGLIAIYMAYTGFGVWSLAAKYVASSFFICIIFWIYSPWKPKLIFNKKSFDKLFGFGSRILITGLIHTGFGHIYKIVIGKFFTASTLGLYTQAENFQKVASSNLITAIQKVTYPALSKFQNDEVKLKSNFRKLIQLSSFIIFPTMTGLALLAEPVIILTIGEQWIDAIPFLQALCAIGIIYHLNAVNVNLLKVLGRSDLFLKAEILKKITVITAIAIGLIYGIWGLIIGKIISSYIGLFINTYFINQLITYSLLEQIIDVVRIFIKTVFMGLIVCIPVLLITNLWGQLIVGVFVGIVGYFLINLLYDNKQLNQLLSLKNI